MKKFTRGFTLIELLVVIAIIGILASIVLVSLNGARSKGTAARMQEEANQLRTTYESDYNGSSYPDLKTSIAGATGADGFAATGINAGVTTLKTDLSTNGVIQVYDSGCTAGTGATCTAYSIEVAPTGNPSTNGNGFCVDSTGKTATGLTGTTFTANATCPANAASL